LHPVGPAAGYIDDYAIRWHIQVASPQFDRR
jgi:hypothetical protein